MTESKEETFPFEKLTLAELLTTDFLTCSQCEKRYDSPILLPCLHTLCEQCVTELTEHKDITQSNDISCNSTEAIPDSTSKPSTHAQDNDTNCKTKESAKLPPPANDTNCKTKESAKLPPPANDTNCKTKECAKSPPQANHTNCKTKECAKSPPRTNDTNCKTKESAKSPPRTNDTNCKTKESAKSPPRTNAQANDTNCKTREGATSPKGTVPANDSNFKTIGCSKALSKPNVQVTDTNQNGNNKLLHKTRLDTKHISANADESQVPKCRENDAKFDSSNTSAILKSTAKPDAQSNPSNMNGNEKMSSSTINGEADMESSSERGSNHQDTITNETESTKISDHQSSSSASKLDDSGVKQIRIQCPVCLSVIESNGKNLKLYNTFVKHLCEVRNYKDENGRSCEYCKYDGKTTTATTLCLHCHDDLCDACVKAHQRTRVTRDHKLAPYEQIQKGLYDHDIRSHQNVICLSHNNVMDVFCLTCAVLLCHDCKTEKHKEHRVLHVTKIFPKYKQQLESFLQGMKRRIPTVSDYLAFLTNHSNKITETKQEIHDLILKQAELIHKLIDDHKTRLIDNLSEACDQEQEGVQMKCEDISTAQFSLTKNSEFLSHLVKLGKPEEVLAVHQQITNRLKQLVNMKPDNLTMRLSTIFTPGSATEQNIAIMFGNLTLERVPFDQKDSKHPSLTVASLMPVVLSPPELVRSFDMKGSNDSTEVWPTGLAITETNYVIVDRDNKVVKIFNKNGKLETQFSGKGENRLGSPFDATILKNGNIAVTDYKSENVKIFTQSGEFVMAINDHFRYPRGITTNHKGEIVVVDCHKLQITTHNSETGECVSTISGTDEINKHLVDPYYIAVTDADNFVVTDHAAPNIKIFNQKGECLAQYGTYGINTGQVLQPYGVCVDRNGYIFIADHQNSRIHLLLPDGRFSKFLLTKLDKVRNPVMIGIDKDDQLLIAEAHGKVNVWKYM